MADTKNSANKPRPLSPHLQVYRWPVTMLTSILHRMSGVGLGLGVLFLACWLVALSIGEDAYNAVQAFHATYLGRIMLLGFCWALIFHMLNGIRHLFWDVGLGFEPKAADRTGGVVLALSAILTLGYWYLGYLYKGGVI